MTSRKKVLAIVPARGGSKSIPRKNIVDVHGKPLIAWSINQAIMSQQVDSVFVSTDDHSIAKVAIEYGARCDFLRPNELSGDAIGTAAAIEHVINELKSRGEEFDIVLELQPTYCFRGSKLVASCIEMLADRDHLESVITCTEVRDTSHPDYVMATESSGLVRYGNKKPDQFARQLLTPAYACKGIVLASRVNSFLNKKSFFTDKTASIIVDEQIRALDINDQMDLEIVRGMAALYPEALN